MASRFGNKPPVWFTIVAVLLILWGLMGCASLYMHFAYGPDMDPDATDWDRAYYAALPLWLDVVYFAAVGAGLFGSIALLARSRWAATLYAVSLVAVVVQFGYILLGTELVAVKGVWVAYFPAFIFAVALFQVWISRLALGKRWLR